MVSLLATSLGPLDIVGIAALLLAACGVMAWIFLSAREVNLDRDDPQVSDDDRGHLQRPGQRVVPGRSAAVRHTAGGRSGVRSGSGPSNRGS